MHLKDALINEAGDIIAIGRMAVFEARDDRFIPQEHSRLLLQRGSLSIAGLRIAPVKAVRDAVTGFMQVEQFMPVLTVSDFLTNFLMNAIENLYGETLQISLQNMSSAVIPMSADQVDGTLVGAFDEIKFDPFEIVPTGKRCFLSEVTVLGKKVQEGIFIRLEAKLSENVGIWHDHYEEADPPPRILIEMTVDNATRSLLFEQSAPNGVVYSETASERRESASLSIEHAAIGSARQLYGFAEDHVVSIYCSRYSQTWSKKREPHWAEWPRIHITGYSFENICNFVDCATPVRLTGGGFRVEHHHEDDIHCETPYMDLSLMLDLKGLHFHYRLEAKEWPKYHGSGVFEDRFIVPWEVLIARVPGFGQRRLDLIAAMEKPAQFPPQISPGTPAR